MNFEKMHRRTTERRSFAEHQSLKARKGKLHKTRRGQREEFAV
ncbi:hypothetical protein QS468_24935 [Bacillus subtilis]|nr:hypothetical protein [Pseudomonas sp. A29(2023)]MDL5595987.1 hypothetical protein [Bacillus subtilis]